MVTIGDRDFPMENWFDDWRRQLGGPVTASPIASEWMPSLRAKILEALSDSSAEQLLNPLLASHLRHFGRRWAALHAPTKWFWVRSEWEKVDVSYGLSAPFGPGSRAWDDAWRAGTTGDLGQLEAKVCYTHLYRGRVMRLVGQLEERRALDRARRPSGVEKQRYHGVIWLFGHGDIERMQDVGKAIENEAVRLGLEVRRPFEHQACADVLGKLWPSTGGEDYRCGVAVALVELA